MLDLDQLQTLGQLVDNLDILTKRLEKSFETNSSEEFSKSKKEILDIQDKISKMVDQK